MKKTNEPEILSREALRAQVGAYVNSIQSRRLSPMQSVLYLCRQHQQTAHH